MSGPGTTTRLQHLAREALDPPEAAALRGDAAELIHQISTTRRNPS